VRHETCLACRCAPDPVLYPLTMIAESFSPQMHHHHAMTCEACERWWFDDVIIGGLGLPVTARRDTMMCDCPEDKAHKYAQSVISVPEPEASCHCTASKVERHRVDIHTGRGQR
jgi:hypothetical protein